MKNKGEDIFKWNDVPGRDNERLINHLVKNRKIEWVKDAEIKKTDDNTITITKGENLLEMKLQKDKVILKVAGGKTYTYDVKKEDGYLSIYKSDREILVFWLTHAPILSVIFLSLGFLTGIICYYLPDYFRNRGCWMLSWLSSSPSDIMRDVLTIFILFFLFSFLFALVEILRKRYNLKF